MPNESGGVAEASGDDSATRGGAGKRARPALQIYRPGMLKKGEDITLQPRGRRDDDATSQGGDEGGDGRGPRPPPSHHRRPPKAPLNDDRGNVRLNFRRRSSPDSVSGRSNVSSVHNSGSTTPEAGTPTRGGGHPGERRFSGERRSSAPRLGRGGTAYGGGGSRQHNGDSRESSVRGSTDDVRSTGSYNSTQSLLNPRRTGGYLEFSNSAGGRRGFQDRSGAYSDRSGGGSGFHQHDDRNERRGGGGRYSADRAGGGYGGYSDRGPPAAYTDRRAIPPLLPGMRTRPAGGGLQPFDRRDGDRASLRAEEGTRRLGRRRNDSITSTQSEMPIGTMPSGGGGMGRDRGATTTDNSCAVSEAGTNDGAGGGLWDSSSIASIYSEMQDMDWVEEMEKLDRERFAAQRAAEEEKARQDAERAEARKRREAERAAARVEREAELDRAREKRRQEEHAGELATKLSRVQLGESQPVRGGGGPHGILSRIDRGGRTVAGTIGGRNGRVNGRGYKDENEEEEEVDDEEGEDEEDEEDGQRTPTGEEKGNASYGRLQDSSVQGAFDGDGGPSTSSRGPIVTGRMAARITREPTGSAERRTAARPERGSYVPPGLRGSAASLAMRVSTDNGSPSGSDDRVRARDSRGVSQDEPPSTEAMVPPERKRSEREDPVAAEERAAIRQVEDELRGVLDSLSKKKDAGKARQIALLSSRLSEMHGANLTKDIRYTFGRNGEAALFRSAFHQPITVLKTCSNSAGEEATACRKTLLRLVQEGISFYGRVISRYDQELGVRLADRLAWPEGVSPPSLSDAVTREEIVGREEDATRKIALCSLGRHLVCLGDLHRYRSTVEGDDDYSQAQRCYLQSTLLLPTNGHAYNQLSLLAFYQMLYRSFRRARLTPLAVLSNTRQERVLNEFFYAARAIGASHPYEAMRDRFAQRMAAARKKGEKYEVLLDKQMGRVQGEAEVQERSDRPREIWIDDTGKEEAAEGRPPEATQLVAEAESSQLHRRVVSYAVYVVSLLAAKIGMERFPSAAARLFAQLRELLRRPDCPLTSVQVVQLAALLIHAVHVTSASSPSSSSSSFVAHCNLAVRTLLTLLHVLLEVVASDLPSMAAAVRGEADAEERVQRVLPGIFVICEWMASTAGRAVYANQDNLRPLDLQLMPRANLWETLAEVVYALSSLDSDGVLPAVEENREDAPASTRVVLPESLLLCSFVDAFPSHSKHFSFKGTTRPESPSRCALLVRLRCLFAVAEFLDGVDAIAFVYSVERKRFEATDTFDHVDDEEETRMRRRREETSLSPPPSSSPFPSGRRLIVVRPSFLCIDTNAFVDNLALVQRVVDSGRYSVLVPTTVIDELIGLGLGQGRSSLPSLLGGLSAGGTQPDSAHAAIVVKSAKEATAWLKEQARAKNGRMGTLTTKGVKVAFAMLNEEAAPAGDKVNDDRILEACAIFADSLPQTGPTPSAVAAENPIHRAVVLITDDRGMNIKANARNLPVRTIHSFLAWAKMK